MSEGFRKVFCDVIASLIVYPIMIVIGVGVALAPVAILTGCNQQIIDLNLKFEEAIIKQPDGSTITVEVKKWTDYADGDQIQVTAKDGTVYLVHSNNVTLIHKRKSID